MRKTESKLEQPSAAGLSPNIDTHNSGAVELSRDQKSCHRSRHVDRRYFKVRELSFEGVLRVIKVPTADNPSDLLTKPLAFDSFVKHAKRLMNAT